MSRSRSTSPTRPSQDRKGQHNQHQDDGNPQEDQPFRHSFWSPAVAQQRALYIKTVVFAALLTTIVLLSVLSIYWGALWDTDNGLYNINAAVVDFDGSTIGQSISQAFTSTSGPKTQPNYYTVSSTDFASPRAVGQAVVDERFWLAIVINPGSTAALNAAIANADAAYDGSNAVTVYLNEARAQQAYSTYIMPALQETIKQAQMMFGVQNAKALADNVNLATLLRNAPQVVAMPLGFQMAELRPFDVPVADAPTFVGLIYLLIISFLAAMQQFNARMESGLEQKLSLRSLLLTRFTTSFALYFWLSWFYSLLSLAFQAPFSRYYGSAGFVIYWAMSFVAMSALGLAMESMITLLTPKFVPFFLVLWIIVNVSVAFYPIEILPAIYRYGYATPFYNVSRTVRAVLFNTRNQIGLNFGVQFAWIGISTVALTVFQILVRRRTERKMTSQTQANGKGSP